MANRLVLIDDGGETTEASLRYFRQTKKHLGVVFRVSMDERRVFSMELVGDKAVMLLSGVGCGYVGTACSLGAIQVLQVLGEVPHDVAGAVCLKGSIRLRLKRGVWEVDPL